MWVVLSQHTWGGFPSPPRAPPDLHVYTVAPQIHVPGLFSVPHMYYSQCHTPARRDCDPHFTDEETKAQGDESNLLKESHRGGT